ncbi:MAG: hypothetical protein LBR10_07240 [Prevotellaceae bacterium]|jgi:hypothetical protein|nr:hypothetical protein [Prevotellaceae bacterium]
MKMYSKQMQPALIYSAGAMETGDHSKNGASPKSHMSRGNTIARCSFLLIFALPMLLMQTSCKNDGTKDDANNSVNSTEEVNKDSGNLEEDYTAWFQLRGKYVEHFNLKIAEVNVDKYTYDGSFRTEDLVVALVENLTDKERGGFFIMRDVYFPVASIDEEIAVLENIALQMKNEIRKYNCQRRYVTAYGITITFHFSSESNWDEIQILYSSDKHVVSIKPDYLMNYIQGLKDCKQYIIDFKAGKWSNK